MPEPLVAVRPIESSAIPTATRAPSAEGESFAEHLDEADLAATTPETPVEVEAVAEEVPADVDETAAVPTDAPPTELGEVPAPFDDEATLVETLAPETDIEVAVPLTVAPLAADVTLDSKPIADVAETAGSGKDALPTELVTPEESGDPLASESDLETAGESVPDTEIETETPPTEASDTPIEIEPFEVPAPNVERTAVTNQADPTAPTAPTVAPSVTTTEVPRVAPPAPPPPTSPAPLVLPEATTSFVTERMRTMLRDGGGEARLHLRPPELGAVTLSVIVEDGRVRATIDAERADVAEKLRKHGPDLRDALKEEGFSIEYLSIGAGGADGRPGAHGDPRAVAFWMEGLADGAPSKHENDPGPTRARRIRHVGPGGIDLLA